MAEPNPRPQTPHEAAAAKAIADHAEHLAHIPPALKARAVNAVGPALQSRGEWLRLSTRQAVAAAVLVAVKDELDTLAGAPDVQGRCPVCSGTSLLLGEGGHVTCSRIDCPDPSAADSLLHGTEVTLPARCPSVEIRNAPSERLDELHGAPTVFAGGSDSRLLIDGVFYAVSSTHPVVLDPFGPGIRGGLLTLTLACDNVTINGKEVGDA